MKTGKNNRFLASILAASMMLTMSPFAFAAADTAEQKEMTTQEQVQPATQNETNANLNCTPFVRQYDILSNRWGDLLCCEENRTNGTRRNSRSWSWKP